MTSPTPARVSGPGALAQRTDGGQPIRHIADAKYGEDKAFVEQQKAAPLADGPGQVTAGGQPPSPSAMPSPGPAGGGPGPSAPPPQIIPLSAPTRNPNQPVTTGAQFGPPPKPDKPELKPDQLSQALAPYFAADNTGILVSLAWDLAEMGL